MKQPSEVAGSGRDDRGIVAASAYLPAGFSIAACESNLGLEARRLDYSFCYRDLPATLTRLQRMPTDVPGQVAWTDIRRALARWARLAPLTGFPGVWVEVDNLDEGRLRPFLVHTLVEVSDNDHHLRVQRTRLMTMVALDLSPADPLLDGLDALVCRLPPWCAVRHVALRPTPGSRVLRAICRMPITQASRFASGGKESLGGRAIDQLIARVHSDPVTTNVNFDITPALGPRIGLEFQMEGAPSDDSRWHKLFDALEELGLLCREKRDALSAWATPLSQRAAMMTERMVRDILVKVDFDAERAYQAKAYLPFAIKGSLVQLSGGRSISPSAA
jgi:hypothetical protein